MATYEKGDPNADEVKLIQQALGIRADGRFGSETVAAIKSWQKANGHKADGMAGPDLLAALGIDELLRVEVGDEGLLVSRIQSELGLAADGEYGKATAAAVRAYQKKNGLKATGTADVATLERLGLMGAADTAPEAPAERRAPSAPAARTPAPAAPDSASVPRKGSVATTGSRVAVRSWAYQLADIDPATIAGLPVDLVVVDYAADGDDASAFKPADVARMKSRPDGGTKKLVSYMSIGEAEDYRYYWQKSWKSKKSRPAWLDDLNPDWEGNYKVRFWDPEWQAIILGSASAYLDKIIAAGFDGVYLDIIDAFEYWRDEKGERPEADRDMIAFVTRIAEYARARRPDFMVIPQNGEALLDDPAYRRVISAQGKEDIFYGQDEDGQENDGDAVRECLDHLAKARAEGIPILAIEYLDDDGAISQASTQLADAGCCAYFGKRALDEIDTSRIG